jgi:hypothetical protein
MGLLIFSERSLIMAATRLNNAAALLSSLFITAQHAVAQCEWSPVGAGVNTSALAMTTYDQGAGEQLVMGGIFQIADGNTVRGLARWNGSQWNAIGTGFDGDVRALPHSMTAMAKRCMPAATSLSAAEP